MTELAQAASPFIVRAALLEARNDAGRTRADAASDAARILDEARAAADAIRDDARREAAAAAARLLDTAEQAAQAMLAARAAELGVLAFAIAERLVGSLPRSERTAQLVQTALAEHRDHARLIVRAPPYVAASLRAALATQAVEVREDPSLGSDECVLLHGAGRTELGPLEQFRALMQASRAA